MNKNYHKVWREKHPDYFKKYFRKYNKTPKRKIYLATLLKSPKYKNYLKKLSKTPKYKRIYNKKAIRYRLNNPQKYKARYTVFNAIKSGKLIKLPCLKCGEIKVEAHHENYEEPLKVVWLCKRHHNELTNKR